MNDEMFIKKYEELLDKGYCDCNEMNCIDNNTPRRILNVVKNLQQENQQLKAKIKTYEEPEDLTLMFMYCNEKAKDKIKELEEQLKTKHNGFMASVDESCDLAEEIQKYKEVIDKAIMYVNSTRYSDINGLQKYSIKEFWFIKELEDILKEVE